MYKICTKEIFTKINKMLSVDIFKKRFRQSSLLLQAQRRSLALFPSSTLLQFVASAAFFSLGICISFFPQLSISGSDTVQLKAAKRFILCKMSTHCLQELQSSKNLFKKSENPILTSISNILQSGFINRSCITKLS